MLLRYLVWGAVLILPILVSGCSSVGYVYNDTLVRNGIVESESQEENEKNKDKIFYIPKQLGAVKVKDSSVPEGERLFILKREKTSILAETKIYDGKTSYYDRAYMTIAGSTRDYVGLQFRFEDDNEKYFEKAYFNIGANKKKKRVGLEIKFVY